MTRGGGSSSKPGVVCGLEARVLSPVQVPLYGCTCAKSGTWVGFGWLGS